MISDTELAKAKARIVQMFEQQCRHGQQTVSLPDNRYAACGQFLKSTQMGQRGLHGTAAALRVLEGDGASQLSERMINYLLERGDAEQGVSPDKLTADGHNVVKQSEILYALSFLRRTAPLHRLKEDIAKRLTDGVLQGQGWPYFLDEADAPQPLPTLLAVRALRAHKEPVVEGAFGFLLEHLRAVRARQTDVFVQVAILFGLTYLDEADPPADDRELRNRLDHLWRGLEPLLDQDLESNHEYTKGGNKYYYVRIPWQLYLIAAAARLRPLRRFASAASTRRLRVIVEAIESEEGFYYPHSTDRVSSRTYATIYDVLSKIDNLRRHGFRSSLAFAFDSVRRFFGSRFMSVVLLVVAAGAFVFSFLSWLREPTTGFGDLFPGVAVSLAFFIAGIRRRP